MRSKNVYFTYTNFDKRKNYIFEHEKKIVFISMQVRTANTSTKPVSYPLDYKNLNVNTMTFTTFKKVK